MDQDSVKQFLKNIVINSAAQGVSIASGLPDKMLSGQSNELVISLILGSGFALTEDVIKYVMGEDTLLINNMNYRAFADVALYNSMVNYAFAVANVDEKVTSLAFDYAPDMLGVTGKRALALGLTGVAVNTMYDYLNDNMADNSIVDLLLHPTNLIF